MKHNKLIVLLLAINLLISQVTLATCVTTIIESTPDTRFTTNGDTVVDNATGLTWMRCSLGQSWDGSSCVGFATGINWSGALDTAETTSFAGVSDWRLPNIKELASIVEEACFAPAINETVFPSTFNVNGYWSSSPSAGNSSRAWVVHFNDGYDNTNLKSSNRRVRLVRGGQ